VSASVSAIRRSQLTSDLKEVGISDVSAEHSARDVSAPCPHSNAYLMRFSVVNRFLTLSNVAETQGFFGVPGVTRTRDPQFRKLLLYPAELRGLLEDQAFTGLL
jgi:hypothetical protein